MADLVYMTKTAWQNLLASIKTKAGYVGTLTASQAKTAVDSIQTGGGSGPDHYISYTFDTPGEAYGDVAAEVHGINIIRPYTFYNHVTLRSIDLPDTVTSIGDFAFYNCSVYNPSSLPDSITRIGKNSFQSCTTLNITTLPASITTIGANSFNGTAIETLNIPAGLSSIPANAFSSSTRLDTIILRKADNIVTLANANAFTGTKIRGTGGVAYVPQDLITTYQGATNWSSLYSGGTLEFRAIEGSIYE